MLFSRKGRQPCFAPKNERKLYNMKIWNKKWAGFGCAAMIACLLLAGCQSAGETSEDRSDLSSDTTSAVSDNAGSESGESGSSANEGNPANAESEPLMQPDEEFYDCMEHSSSYHTIILDLIGFVGSDAYNEWADSLASEDSFGRINEGITVSAFIDHFNVPQEDFTELVQGRATDERLESLGMTREEYLDEYGYTDAQIAALYSGDQAQINAAFCGDLAWYNEADGQLYSIYWLSEHTADDYEAAGIPAEEVTAILNDATGMGGIYADLAEQASAAADAYTASASSAG